VKDSTREEKGNLKEKAFGKSLSIHLSACMQDVLSCENTIGEFVKKCEVVHRPHFLSHNGKFCDYLPLWLSYEMKQIGNQRMQSLLNEKSDLKRDMVPKGQSQLFPASLLSTEYLGSRKDSKL